MSSSPSLAFAALLLASCTAFSGADVDPPSGGAGAAGSTSGSSGQGGSLASGGAGQGGVAGGSSVAGSGGQAGMASGASGGGGLSGGGGSGGSDSGASGDGGSAGTGGQPSAGMSGSSGQSGGAGSSAGGSAGSTSGAAGSTSGAAGSTAGSTSGASGTAGKGGSVGGGAGASGGSAGTAGAAGQGGSGGAVCGDGVVQSGEECDDGQGNSSMTGGCSTACKKLCPTVPGGVSLRSGTTCYFELGDDVSWDDARSKCSNYGGKGHYALVSIESLAEFNAIKGPVTTFGFDGFWTGGHRVNTTLTWLSGSEIDFTSGVAPWGKNQPKATLDCVSLESDFIAATLATSSCDATRVPLCEW